MLVQIIEEMARWKWKYLIFASSSITSISGGCKKKSNPFVKNLYRWNYQGRLNLPSKR